jgi:hypothetical protein
LAVANFVVGGCGGKADLGGSVDAGSSLVDVLGVDRLGDARGQVDIGPETSDDGSTPTACEAADPSNYCDRHSCVAGGADGSAGSNCGVVGPCQGNYSDYGLSCGPLITQANSLGEEYLIQPICCHSCSPQVTSSLPGVRIDFQPPTRCTFTLAEARAGISIPYDVIIANDVPNVIPSAADDGKCATPDPSGLIVFERISGSNQNYCLCDTGRCPTDPFPSATLRAGRYGGVFSWDGTNWNGPSDFGIPKGPPFPAGSYTLQLRSVGIQNGTAFEVSTKTTIRLVP